MSANVSVDTPPTHYRNVGQHTTDKSPTHYRHVGRHTTDALADILPTRWSRHYRHVGRNTTDTLVEILTLYNFVSSFSWKEEQRHKERRKRDRQIAAIFKMKH